MVVWQNSLVGASKRGALRPLFQMNPFSKNTFSNSPKQGWVPLLVIYKIYYYLLYTIYYYLLYTIYYYLLLFIIYYYYLLFIIILFILP